MWLPVEQQKTGGKGKKKGGRLPIQSIRGKSGGAKQSATRNGHRDSLAPPLWKQMRSTLGPTDATNQTHSNDNEQRHHCHYHYRYH